MVGLFKGLFKEKRMSEVDLWPFYSSNLPKEDGIIFAGKNPIVLQKGHIVDPGPKQTACLNGLYHNLTAYRSARTGCSVENKTCGEVYAERARDFAKYFNVDIEDILQAITAAGDRDYQQIIKEGKSELKEFQIKYENIAKLVLEAQGVN